MILGISWECFLTAVIDRYPPRKERKSEGMKSLRIDPAWSRCVTVSLVFVAIFGIVLIRNMRRKSGLLSNPQGIAGIAAMATKSHILTDFRGLDTAPIDKIHKQLRHRRYNLHKSALWQGEYIRNSTEKIPDTGSDPRPLMLRLRAGIPYICYLVLFMGAIPVLLFVEGAAIVADKLPFFLTALATAVKVLWGTMNNDIRKWRKLFMSQFTTYLHQERSSPFSFSPKVKLRLGRSHSTTRERTQSSSLSRPS